MPLPLVNENTTLTRIASVIQCESLPFMPPKRSTECSIGSGNGNLSLVVAGLALEWVEDSSDSVLITVVELQVII